MNVEKWNFRCNQLIVWMRDDNTLCCSDGNFFRSIDIGQEKNGDVKQAWEEIDDLVDLSKTYNKSN